MLTDTISSIKTRSPFRVFVVFAIGIVLPGGFLSVLGLRSFQYESALMQKQAEEHYSAAADLMQRKAGEQLFEFTSALQAVAENEKVRPLNTPDCVPHLLTINKLSTSEDSHALMGGLKFRW